MLTYCLAFITSFLTTRLILSIILYKSKMRDVVQIRCGTLKGYFPFYDYECKTLKDLPKISFEDFLKIYNVNRSAYELCDGYVKRENSDKEIVFSFKFFDHRKYKKFKKNKEKYDRKMKRKEEECEVISELIRLSKEDIERAKEEVNKSFEEAMETVEKITLKM